MWAAQQPEQVWRVFIGILDDFVQVFDTAEMTLETLQDVFKAAFDSANYAGVPSRWIKCIFLKAESCNELAMKRSLYSVRRIIIYQL